MIIKKVEDDWVFSKGKYEGKTLDEVAKDNPGYLRWAHSKASDDLSDEAYYALEDVMEKNGIEPE